MSSSRRARRALTVIAVILIPPGAGPHAKGAADQWYFTGSLGYVATRDTIANNAGEPFDPRPSHFESRETDVHDGPGLAFQLGFGLTRSFSIQLDAGYSRGEVGPIDVYLQDQFPVAADPLNPTVLNLMHSREQTIPVSAGELTQIPIGLSGILRFRTDRTFNPYIGGGGGRIYARMDDDGDVTDLNARLGRLRIRSLRDEHQMPITPNVPGEVVAEARIPWVYPVSVEVDDAWEGHIMAGLEWSASDRLSIVAEARYTFTGQSVLIDLQGQDQVNASIFSEKLFRKDGSVAQFNQVPQAPNPFIDNNPALGHVGCMLTTTGDFDGDGHLGDLCYPQTFEPEGIFLVQGGEINLSQTTLSVGLRVYF